MSEYNISQLITIMMDAFADTQVNTGSILLNTVASHPNVNVDVNDNMISRLVTRERDVHKELKRASGKEDVIKYARNKVKNTVLNEINPVRMDDICSNILQSMSEDKKVSDGFCDKMQKLYVENNLLDFFTDAILYALSVTNLPPEETVQLSDFIFLKEVNYYCPIDRKKLWKKTKGEYKYIYHIVKIYPEDLNENLADEFDAIQRPPRNLDMDDNKICLCRDCAEDYLNDPTIDIYSQLLKCKENIARDQRRYQIAADTDIEDEIVDIIEAIVDIEEKADLQPFTDALEIKDKILPENYSLCMAITDDVVRYYPFIEQQFSLLDGVEGSTFNIIRSEVTLCYEKYEKAGLSQDEIFNALTEWLLNTKGLSDKHRIAAMVMVSFFVQNCAVFKKHGLINDTYDDIGSEDI